MNIGEATTFHDNASAGLLNLCCTSRGQQGQRILMALRAARGGGDMPGLFEVTHSSGDLFTGAGSEHPKLTFGFGLEPSTTAPCAVGERENASLHLDAVDLVAGTVSGSMSGTLSSPGGATDCGGGFDIQG